MPIDILGVARYRMPERTIAVSAVEKLPPNCRSKSSPDLCTPITNEVETVSAELRLCLDR